jgi:hypothetical protein
MASNCMNPQVPGLALLSTFTSGAPQVLTFKVHCWEKRIAWDAENKTRHAKGQE